MVLMMSVKATDSISTLQSNRKLFLVSPKVEWKPMYSEVFPVPKILEGELRVVDFASRS